MLALFAAGEQQTRVLQHMQGRISMIYRCS